MRACAPCAPALAVDSTAACSSARFVWRRKATDELRERMREAHAKSVSIARKARLSRHGVYDPLAANRLD